ncbi:MAG: hypothetical protein BGO99_09070 [Nitrosospira sp. 56-18]|jgi:hypothetical protein|nr:hypothetical protein [Nitrosospira sp.]OJY13154.1 MAG: hypothetical protein BGO99_09070 [Nitrosospira sp. 56-18]
MIKFLSSLIIVSAALGISDPSSAQEAFGGHMGHDVSHGLGHIPSALHANTGLDSPFIRSFPSFSLDSSSGLGSHFSSSSGLGTSPSVPRVLLPLPINGPLWGSQSRYGFQYPGSYLPAGTPLHRYNGYIVCNPPAAAAGKRMVKITTTRSLAAPGDTQPCPVYTIDGEVPKTKNYTTTSVPSTTRNPPP